MRYATTCAVRMGVCMDCRATQQSGMIICSRMPGRPNLQSYADGDPADDGVATAAMARRGCADEGPAYAGLARSSQKPPPLLPSKKSLRAAAPPQGQRRRRGFAGTARSVEHSGRLGSRSAA